MIKIGDRVKAKKDCPRVGGMVGTVVCFEKDSKTDENYGVSFDKFKKGHSLNGELKGNERNSGWWMDAENLEKVPKKIKIVITDMGDRIEIVRKDKKHGFSQFYGKGEDFEKLYPKLLQRFADGEVKRESKLNTKIVIVKGDEIFKVGRIYEIKDGAFVEPFVAEMVSENNFKNLDALRFYFSGFIDFVELKED